MDIQSLLDNIIFLNLLFLTIIYWASLIAPKVNLFSTISSYGNILANFSLFMLLGLRWLNFGYFPLSNLYESLLFLAWGITFITLVIENRSRINMVGCISTPMKRVLRVLSSLQLKKRLLI